MADAANQAHISNKFQDFPDILTKIMTLWDLDVSFNMISELPESIRDLENLERLILVGNQVTKLPGTMLVVGEPEGVGL